MSESGKGEYYSNCLIEAIKAKIKCGLIFMFNKQMIKMTIASCLIKYISQSKIALNQRTTFIRKTALNGNFAPIN